MDGPCPGFRFWGTYSRTVRTATVARLNNNYFWFVRQGMKTFDGEEDVEIYAITTAHVQQDSVSKLSLFA